MAKYSSDVQMVEKTIAAAEYSGESELAAAALALESRK
jgi:hypothetical protein